MPYAVKNVGGEGRIHAHEEKPDETRTRFSIDVGRIDHSSAFRGLDKTQVYSSAVVRSHNPATRWSHSFEVALLAKETARALGVNEDLAFAGGLGHDLGHPPFGHEGEEALDACMKEHGLAFDHNEQTVRIVTLLSYHSDAYRGLNLNRETIDGYRQHTTHLGYIAGMTDHQAYACAERDPKVDANILSRTTAIFRY